MRLLCLRCWTGCYQGAIAQTTVELANTEGSNQFASSRKSRVRSYINSSFAWRSHN